MLSPGLCKYKLLKELSLLLEDSRDLPDSCSCLSWVHSAWRWAGVAGGGSNEDPSQVIVQKFASLLRNGSYILGLSSIVARFILNVHTNNHCMLILQ